MRVAVQEACRHQIRGPPGPGPTQRPKAQLPGFRRRSLSLTRKAFGFPFSIARDPSGSSLALLKEPDLPLVPGGQPGKGPGPVLPTQPGHRRQHHGSKGHSLKNGGLAAYDPAQPDRSTAKPRDRHAGGLWPASRPIASRSQRLLKLRESSPDLSLFRPLILVRG